MRGARRLGHLAGGEIASGLPHGERHRRFEQRHADELPAPVAVARAQRGEHGDRRVQRGGEIGDRHADLDRRGVRLARDAHQPRHRLRDDVEPGELRVRSVVAEAGRREVDQPRRLRQQRGVTEAERVHRPGPQVFDHDVGARSEPAEQRFAVLGLQIEGDAALVAVEPHEVRALVAEERSRRAREVAAARVLHLEDLSAQIGELHPAERDGHEVADLDDADAVERRKTERMRSRALSPCGPLLLVGQGGSAR